MDAVVYLVTLMNTNDIKHMIDVLYFICLPNIGVHFFLAQLFQLNEDQQLFVNFRSNEDICRAISVSYNKKLYSYILFGLCTHMSLHLLHLTPFSRLHSIQSHILCTASYHISCALHPITYLVHFILSHILCTSSYHISCALHPITYLVHCILSHILCTAFNHISCALYPITYLVHCILSHILCTASYHISCAPHPILSLNNKSDIRRI